MRNRFDVVAPLAIRLVAKQTLDAFRKDGWTRLFDRSDGGSNLVLRAGLVQLSTV
jgi:hypothetical protein